MSILPPREIRHSGIGADHAPNALITVNPFVEAWTNTDGFQIVPQQGTAAKLDTLGDKIMTPVVYQNAEWHGVVVGGPDHNAEFPQRADCCSLVSIRCYRRHFPCNPCCNNKIGLMAVTDCGALCPA